MIEVRHLNKIFHLKSGDVTALEDVSFRIEEGSVYGVIGYSGAGKSTLVRCLNLLEYADSGEIEINGQAVVLEHGQPSVNGRKMSSREQSAMRRGIGMIFQHFNLLDRLTVFDNIAYPLRHTGRSRKETERRVWELLELVSLTDKADVFPSQLSGGQKQRVAIARALAGNPPVLLSDEATSALDPEATESILALLKELNRKLGITIVLITHEMSVIKRIADRVAVMEDGRIVEEGSVYDLFSDPGTEISKRFVASSSLLGKIDSLIRENAELVKIREGELLVRLIFEKECVGEHVLTSAAKETGVDLNLLLADAEYLQGSPLGGIVGILSGTPESIEKGIAYLAEHHVKTEVLRDGRIHPDGRA